MSITTTNRSDKTTGVTPRYQDNALAATLQHDHELVQAWVGDALRASERMCASTQEFSDRTQTLTGLVSRFTLS